MQAGPDQHGLIEIGMGATACMLISVEVLAAMPRPWFEAGRLGQDTYGEDTWFCAKARRLGFQMFCDLDVSIGHLVTTAVWPSRHEDTGQMVPRYGFTYGEAELQEKSYTPLRLRA